MEAGRPAVGSPTAAEMPPHACRVRGGHEAEPDRHLEGQRHADGDALAMQNLVAIAEGRFERMAERVAEIRGSARRPVSRSSAATMRRLGAAALLDRLGPRCAVAGDQPGAIRFQPVKNSASSISPYFTTSA